MRIVLEPRDAGELFFGQSSGRPQEDGTFVLEGVAVGDYNLRLARLPQDHYLQSARLAGEDVLEEGLNVPGGGLSDRLEIVVSAAGARVEGAVLNDEEQPYGGARVVLVPEARQRHRRELFKSAVSDQNGRFVLRGIAPGEYKLFAWEQVEQGAWQDAEFLRRYEEQGQVIRIDEGATHGAELALIPATGR